MVSVPFPLRIDSKNYQWLLCILIFKKQWHYSSTYHGFIHLKISRYLDSPGLLYNYEEYLYNVQGILYSWTHRNCCLPWQQWKRLPICKQKTPSIQLHLPYVLKDLYGTNQATVLWRLQNHMLKDLFNFAPIFLHIGDMIGCIGQVKMASWALC